MCWVSLGQQPCPGLGPPRRRMGFRFRVRLSSTFGQGLQVDLSQNTVALRYGFPYITAKRILVLLRGRGCPNPFMESSWAVRSLQKICIDRTQAVHLSRALKTYSRQRTSKHLLG